MTLPFIPSEKPEWATDTQWRAAKAVEEHGSCEKAATALGLTKNAVWEAKKRYDKEAALHGHAPGHFNDGTAPGFAIGKVTIQRNAFGAVERTWERQSPEEARLDAFVARCEERLESFPRFQPVPAPAPASAPLTNFLGLFDLHIGEKISSDDPAGRWDIKTAVRTVKASVRHAIAVAPKAKRIVVCFGGDVGHYDGLSPVTPRSRHVLHSDGDFDDLVDAVLDVAVDTIDHALATHDEVYGIYAEGNHDEASSVWMRKMLARLYADEPRFKMVNSRVPYYALRFGKVMICVHHGHGAKLESLAGKFAAMFREMWGQSVYAYAHAGHQHHIHAKEKDGLIATQHPSLAPSDDYALSKGLVSRRGCMMITYHDEFGEASSNTTRPEMLGVFDAEEMPLAA